MCTPRLRNTLIDIGRFILGLGILANKVAAVIYPPAFMIYYAYLIRDIQSETTKEIILRLNDAFPFVILITILVALLIGTCLSYRRARNLENSRLVQEILTASENADRWDQIGSILLWIVLLVFFGVLVH